MRYLTLSRCGLALLTACLLLLIAVTGNARATSRTRLTTPALTVLAEPQAGVTPFLTMIDRARHSIDLTMYELTDPRVEHALAGAAHRGVNVRVLLNGSYYSQPDPVNNDAFRYLRSHGVHVRYTPTYFALTHQKTLTVDDRESAVMTLNFDGLYASTRDYAVLDTQPADVAAIVAAFNADYDHHHLQPSTGTGDLVWSPGAAPTVLRMIDSARHSIDIENEEMADPQATTALCAAARRGVAVRVVMTYAADWRSAFTHLSACGAHIHLFYGQRYYIHAKLLLVDDRQALVSSQNLSDASLQYNRELGITITTPDLVNQLQHDFATDYAAAATQPHNASAQRTRAV